MKILLRIEENSISVKSGIYNFQNGKVPEWEFEIESS
jgi:hypothetical protein